jgi:hypothetical protein
MNLLKTSPIVIIDDETTEALPVMRALGRLGVGCTYIPGDKLEQLPVPPISGVRLVFMDMQLGTLGTSRQVGTQAANVFYRSINANDIPIVIVLWTKHEEHVEEFKTALYEFEPKFRAGTIIEKMEKPQLSEEINDEAVKINIKSIISKYPPLKFIWTWEQLVYDAATQTSNRLGELVKARIDPKIMNGTDEERLTAWSEAVRHVLRCLIDVAVGKNMTSETAYRDVLEVLAPLHQDRLEHEIIEAASGEFTDVLAMDWQEPSLQEKAATNTMLLIAPVHEDDMAVRPGNLYVPKPDLGDSCLYKMCRVNVEKISNDVLRLMKDTDYRNLKKQLEEAAKQNNSATDIEEKMNIRFQELLGKCIPVLLEISPPCDYAQRKRYVSRFIGGLLVPEEFKTLMADESKSILHIEAVSLPSVNGIWHPIFCGRFVYTLPDPDNLVKSKPICRLRTPILIDILSWCASHAARPGHLSLRGKKR